MMEFPQDSGNKDQTHEPSPMEILDSEETTETVNRIITLYHTGDYEDAEDQLADLLLDWSGRTFNLTCYGQLLDGRADWDPESATGVFDCPALFRRPAIIDDKLHLVFWPESSIVTNPDGSQTATAEIVAEKDDLLNLQYGAAIKIESAVDYTDKSYLDHLASKAHRTMSLAINRPDLTDEDRPDQIRETADAIRDDEEIAAYNVIYKNRIMELSPRRYFTAPPAGMPFVTSLCLSDNTSETTIKGMFSGLVMIEELDTDHQPNITSLCIKLLSTNGRGEVIERYAPLSNLMHPPVCDWADADRTID